MKHGLVQKQKVYYQKSSAAPQFRRSDIFVLKKASYQNMDNKNAAWKPFHKCPAHDFGNIW